MSVPVATTTITIERPTGGDAYDGVSYATYRTGVRAVIGSPSGAEINAGGSSQQVSARLNCDPVDLAHTDRVTDEKTGITYEVLWTARRLGFGVDHTVADLLVITDRAGVA
jgi:hypothetical protein